ncbi:MAG: hypothetical protein ACLUQ6_04610 [Alistipes onderdonkii]
MAPAAEERAVCSLPVQGIVAVMAAHREALRQVEEKLGDRIRYTTPLLREVQSRNTDRMGIPHGGAPIY